MTDCWLIAGGLKVCMGEYIRVIVRGTRSLVFYEGEVYNVDNAFIVLKTARGGKVAVRINEIKVIEWVERDA